MPSELSLNLNALNISTEDLKTFCQDHQIQRLALFGSVLRQDFGPESDIDILVEFEPQAHVGYMRYFHVQDELSALFGRNVDLFTFDSLKPFARETATATQVLIYAT
jgi:predicted nucleotidyltransferase